VKPSLATSNMMSDCNSDVELRSLCGYFDLCQPFRNVVRAKPLLEPERWTQEKQELDSETPGPNIHS
jgi:hypothetical protein